LAVAVSLGIFLVVALAAGLILFAMTQSAPRGRRQGRSRGGYRAPAAHLDRAHFAMRWATIEAMAKGNGNDLRNAINEADKLFDLALSQAGLPGHTMGERLKAARPRFGNYAAYDGVWKAHKLRNALAHEVGFDLVPSQAREAIADFGKGLRELGAL
jgi:hypothetical protein